MTDTTTSTRATAAKAVLVTLAAAQFVMILDASVMNLSIATVAKDLGTTVTGIQTAITPVHRCDRLRAPSAREQDPT